MEDENQFGARKPRELLEKTDIGKYYAVYTQNGRSFSGRLSKIEDGICTMNPYYLETYNNKGKRIGELRNADFKIYTSLINGAMPLERKDLENTIIALEKAAKKEDEKSEAPKVQDIPKSSQ